MPRTADHAQRRSQLIDALLRVASRAGLHAVTMRSVAAEAGVSLRLVQYYFRTKAGLMHAALEELERRAHERWQARLARLPQHAPARAHLEAFLTEALPTDAPSRTFHLVWTSYAVLAMTDPELAREPFVAGPDRLESRITDTLRGARAAGELRPDLDPATEAARLVTLNHGLGTSVLIGQRTAEAATALLSHHLDELFGPEPAG
ncbi:hypothetical protein SacmaDRAFT_3997 [Saccharomonospora marina XMU15]|uniref:HTH tetR-type domain-containing protein n=1 Tax=Saccharomonospora marina XMU15 TaxID=882083 RepID=H5X3X5_9PSEU|nr:TetR/AcrR family transcriptional regulator [Saccharomonospora marina]EHR52193.1 hypothetical protein SacmaDRAFT_3997 [Saccharomonospora marina XMU15]